MSDLRARLRAAEVDLQQADDARYPLIVEVAAGDPLPDGVGPRTVVVVLGPEYVEPPTAQPGDPEEPT